MTNVTIDVLILLTQNLPIGTNLALLHFLWMLVTGALFPTRGAIIPALTYLKDSLAIRQQIGDKAGLCATLFNIGHIHLQKKENQEAISAWVTVYRIAKPMGLAQALQALSDLAPNLGMPPGLDGWEKLALQIQEQSK